MALVYGESRQLYSTYWTIEVDKRGYKRRLCIHISCPLSFGGWKMWRDWKNVSYPFCSAYSRTTALTTVLCPTITVRLLLLAWVPEFDCGQGVECTLCKENLYASYPDSQVPILSVIQNQISWEFRLRHIVGVLTITSGQFFFYHG